LEKDGWIKKIDETIDVAAKSLDSSIETVLDIKDEIRTSVKEKQREIEELRRELDDVMAASDSLAEAYKKARARLAKGAQMKDEALQAEAYEEASRLMKLKGSFEERERNLRRRRDQLERDKARLERMLAKTDETMWKLKLALAVIRENAGSPKLNPSEASYRDLAMALRLVEQESLRLARDVHDGPAQHCSGALLILDKLESCVAGGDAPGTMREIECLREQMRDAVLDFRNFLWRLKPSGLDLGLEHGLKVLAQVISERYKVKVDVVVKGGADCLNGPGRANAYRVIQEAVTNGIRHGGARNVKILASFGDAAATFKVQDDGRGFDPEEARAEAHRRGSFGLVNMEERVRLLGGTLRIDSAPGKGAAVVFSIPLGRLDHEEDTDSSGG